VDWFGPEFGMSYAEVDGCASVPLVVGVILCFLDCFGFLIVLQLFSQCRDLVGDKTGMVQSFEVLWVELV